MDVHHTVTLSLKPHVYICRICHVCFVPGLRSRGGKTLRTVTFKHTKFDLRLQSGFDCEKVVHSPVSQIGLCYNLLQIEIIMS